MVSSNRSGHALVSAPWVRECAPHASADCLSPTHPVTLSVPQCNKLVSTTTHSALSLTCTLIHEGYNKWVATGKRHKPCTMRLGWSIEVLKAGTLAPCQ
eukprot:1159407-Pelagomonas_calceolata.AAC.3